MRRRRDIKDGAKPESFMPDTLVGIFITPPIGKTITEVPDIKPPSVVSESQPVWCQSEDCNMSTCIIGILKEFVWSTLTIQFAEISFLVCFLSEEFQPGQAALRHEFDILYRLERCGSQARKLSPNSMGKTDSFA
jgi:hypothetical protein